MTRHRPAGMVLGARLGAYFESIMYRLHVWDQPCSPDSGEPNKLPPNYKKSAVSTERPEALQQQDGYINP